VRGNPTKTKLRVATYRKKGIDTMATNKKMTKRDHFNALLKIEAVKSNEALVEFINHEIDLLNRKNSTEKKPTATQVANEALKQEIVKCMERDRLYTISEMIKEFPCCSDLSTPKVSAIIRLLKDEGAVVRSEDKRKAYFHLA
jgi:predicted transcriptional regulator